MSTGNSRNNSYRSPGAKLRDSALGAAIAHLPVPVRWIMILGAREGLSARDIANLAGVNIEVVKSLQGRGLALIQKELLCGCDAVL